MYHAGLLRVRDVLRQPLCQRRQSEASITAPSRLAVAMACRPATPARRAAGRYEPASQSSPDQFATFMAAEQKKWALAIKQTGFRLE
ncbi:extra-cytoplasmic solute receptor [Cupriavidus sp. GA3-3]|nr:extra-cytoplasmic solute receptor [Cupriavidus sp. GA3-3]